MKYLFLLVCLGLSLWFNAQTQTAQPPKFSTAIEYNDYIISRQYIVDRFFTGYADLLSDTTSILSEANLYCTTIAYSIKLYVDQISAMPAWNGDTAFRNCNVRRFKFYQTVFEQDFVAMNKLIYKDDYSETDRAEVNRIYHSSDELESRLDAMAHEAQTNFARNNGISLADPANPK